MTDVQRKVKAGRGIRFLDGWIFILQVSAVAMYACVLVFAYTLPDMVQPLSSVYDDAAGAKARILMEAKTLDYEQSTYNASATAASEVPLCGVDSNSNVLSASLPRWALPSDNTDLIVMARAQVQNFLF